MIATSDKAHPVNGVYTVHGLQVQVEVSPCSWMYKHYGFQFGYKGDTCWGYLIRKDLDQATATTEQVQGMLETLARETCECGAVFLFNPTHNRQHQCEQCFMKVAEAQFAKEQEVERRRVKRRDDKMKRIGHKFKVVAWVHPAEGDDYQVDFYLPKKPTVEQVRELLRREGSLVLRDYRVKAL